MSNPIDVVARHLAEQFSCGSMGIHVDDELADGRPLKQVIANAMRTPRTDDNSAILNAFAVVSDVWDSGYDLASGDDFAIEDDTVADIVLVHVNAIAPAKPRIG